ncbi:MAG: endonuclease Q family protein, partial [Patescibacteria group bacterium]
MKFNVDLHSHSGASGGVGDISFDKIYKSMVYKGIDAYGTGDCLFPAWLKKLQGIFTEKDGLLVSEKYPDKYFVLQTELIFTIPYSKNLQKRKAWHNVVLFPSFSAAKQAVALLEKYEVKNTIGRPFITADSKDQLETFLFELIDIDPFIEVIPAHIMTPQGVFGSENPVENLRAVYGNFCRKIHAIETGLSADPVALQMIPELDNLTFFSSSDAHCGRLGRLGREFTQLEILEINYSALVDALRENKVNYTVEFPMTEGRYFLTGHRERKNHPGWCCFAPKKTPRANLCPICGKKLTVGVLQRVLDISEKQSEESRVWGKSYGQDREFKKLVPLVEVVGSALGIKTPNTKTVLENYHQIIEQFGTEADLWEAEESQIEAKLSSSIDNNVLEAILEVAGGNFSFQPPGFDGTYGELVIGEQYNFWETSLVEMEENPPNQS